MACMIVFLNLILIPAESSGVRVFLYVVDVVELVLV